MRPEDFRVSGGTLGLWIVERALGGAVGRGGEGRGIGVGRHAGELFPQMFVILLQLLYDLFVLQFFVMEGKF